MSIAWIALHIARIMGDCEWCINATAEFNDSWYAWFLTPTTTYSYLFQSDNSLYSGHNLKLMLGWTENEIEVNSIVTNKTS